MKSYPHVVYLKVQHQDSKVVNISFKGNINQESCIYAVCRLIDGKKECIKAFFQENMTVPPSDKYRKELNKVDGKSFAAGNLTTARESKTAFLKDSAKSEK